MLPILALIIIPISIIAGKNADTYQKENSKYIEKMSNIFDNLLYIKSLNSEKNIDENFKKNNILIQKYSKINSKIDSFIQPFIMFVLIGIVAIIFMYGGSKVSSGKITVGILIAYLGYVNNYVFQPITN